MIVGKWPTWRTILYYVFIFIFNSIHVSSTSCSSSGETNWVNTTSGNCHSVYCRWSCGVQVGSSLPTCTRHGHRHRATVTRGCVDTVCLSWWWARCAWNMYRVKNKNKYIVKNCASRWSFTNNHFNSQFYKNQSLQPDTKMVKRREGYGYISRGTLRQNHGPVYMWLVI